MSDFPPPDATETTHWHPTAKWGTPEVDGERDDDWERVDGRLADGEAADDWARREGTL